MKISLQFDCLLEWARICTGKVRPGAAVACGVPVTKEKHTHLMFLSFNVQDLTHFVI